MDNGLIVGLSPKHPTGCNKNKDKNGMKRFQGNLLHIKKPLSDFESCASNWRGSESDTKPSSLQSKLLID